MKKLFMLILILSTSIVYASDARYQSLLEFQVKFNAFLDQDFFPTIVHGIATEDGNKFRGLFENFPEGNFIFESRFGALFDVFNQQNIDLKSKGFKLIWVQTFLDARGDVRYQATWVGGSNSIVDCLNRGMFWYKKVCHVESYTEKIATVSESLEINIPILEYKTSSEVQHIRAGLEYKGVNDKQHTWGLTDFGTYE